MRPRSTRKMESSNIQIEKLVSTCWSNHEASWRTFAAKLRNVLEQADDNALVLWPEMGRLCADLDHRDGAGSAIVAGKWLCQPPQAHQARRGSAHQGCRHLVGEGRAGKLTDGQPAEASQVRAELLLFGRIAVPKFRMICSCADNPRGTYRNVVLCNYSNLSSISTSFHHGNSDSTTVHLPHSFPRPSRSSQPSRSATRPSMVSVSTMPSCQPSTMQRSPPDTPATLRLIAAPATVAPWDIIER